MQALLDGDLCTYRCAASAENEPEDIAILRCDKLVRDIIEAVQADTYRIFLSGGENFRKAIDPEYKANRKDKPSPKWLQQCREFLVKEWKAEVTDGIEADDALGIAQCSEHKSWDGTWFEGNVDSCVVCSLDKDLLQIPGRHYRWQIGTAKWTKEAQHLLITEPDAIRSLYISSLVGDKSDNIRGVDGIGPVKAQKALAGCQTEQEMFDVCRFLYKDDERFLKNMKLLYIMREEADFYDFEKRGLIKNE